jgi:MFS family permease
MQWLDTKEDIMFSYILGAALIVAVLGALLATAILAVENEDWRWGAVSVVILIGILASVMYLSDQEESQGPCVKYETQWSYNAATKSNMPYRVCVERGEWVNNG